jgi:hypothetical protein
MVRPCQGGSHGSVRGRRGGGRCCPQAGRRRHDQAEARARPAHPLSPPARVIQLPPRHPRLRADVITGRRSLPARSVAITRAGRCTTGGRRGRLGAHAVIAPITDGRRGRFTGSLRPSARADRCRPDHSQNPLRQEDSPSLPPGGPRPGPPASNCSLCSRNSRRSTQRAPAEQRAADHPDLRVGHRFDPAAEIRT